MWCCKGIFDISQVTSKTETSTVTNCKINMSPYLRTLIFILAASKLPFVYTNLQHGLNSRAQVHNAVPLYLAYPENLDKILPKFLDVWTCYFSFLKVIVL